MLDIMNPTRISCDISILYSLNQLNILSSIHLRTDFEILHLGFTGTCLLSKHGVTKDDWQK